MLSKINKLTEYFSGLTEYFSGLTEKRANVFRTGLTEKRSGLPVNKARRSPLKHVNPVKNLCPVQASL